MKKNITYKNALKNAAFFAFFALSALFAGCSNSVTDSSAGSEKKTSSGAGLESSDFVYTLSGSLGLKGGLTLVNQEEVSRSAASDINPYFREMAVNLSEFTLSAVYRGWKEESGNNNLGVEGTVTYEDGEFLYSIPLNKIGRWEVTAKVSDRLSGSIDVECYPDGYEDFIEEDYKIFLEPITTESATGSISLKISKASDFDAKSVTWTWLERKNTDSNPNYKSIDFSDDGTVQFEFSDVQAGSHEVQLSFVNTAGKEVFKCKEMVSVYKGFVTNQWYGKAPYFVDRETENSVITEFLISDAVLKNQESVEFFTIGTNETNKYEITDTPILLWNSQQNNLLSFIYGSEATRSANKLQGAQFFSEIKGNEDVTVSFATAATGTPDLCFGGEDGKFIYLMSDGYLYRYKKSYCGYVVDYSFSVDLCGLVQGYDDDGYFEYIHGFLGYTYCNGKIYLAIYCGGNTFNFGYYDIKTGDILVAKDAEGNYINLAKEEMSSFGCIAVSEGFLTKTVNDETVKESCVYLAYSETNEYNDHDKTKVYKAIFTIGKDVDNKITGLTFVSNSNKSYCIEEYDTGSGQYIFVDNYFHMEDDRIEITDLMISDEPVGENETHPFVYALIRAQTKNPRTEEIYYKETKDVDGTSTTTFEKFKTIYTSNGGILKFDLTQGVDEFAPSKWTGYGEFSNKYILGWYAESNSKGPLYMYRSDDYKITSNATTVNGTAIPANDAYITVIPPLEENLANIHYFYGPEKFVAIKPKKLVIADDGAYIYIDEADDSKTTVKDINRVVTVDLTTKSISAKDVDVTFSKTLSAGGTSINGIKGPGEL